MKNQPWLYVLFILFAVATFPFILIGSVFIGAGLDFSTTWGSNFQEDSAYMLILPSATLLFYAYGVYWLLKKQRHALKETIIQQYKQETEPTTADRIVTELQLVPNMSFYTLQQATGLPADTLQSELEKLQNGGRINRVLMLDKEFYTLSNN